LKIWTLAIALSILAAILTIGKGLFMTGKIRHFPRLSSAQAQPSAEPRGSVRCEDFKRNPDGSWTTATRTVLVIGTATVGLGPSTIRRRAIRIGGMDVAEFLDQNCGKSER
jgi:hypothetical protein